MPPSAKLLELKRSRKPTIDESLDSIAASRLEEELEIERSDSELDEPVGNEDEQTDEQLGDDYAPDGVEGEIGGDFTLDADGGVSLRLPTSGMNRILAKDMDSLPDAVKNAKVGHGIYQFPEFAALTSRYSALDKIAKSEMTLESVKGRLDAKASAVLSFLGADGKSRITIGSDVTVSGTAPGATITLSWYQSTQLPGLKIHIARPERPEVAFHIFADCLDFEDDMANAIDYKWGKSLVLDQQVTAACPDLVKHRQHGNLFKLRVKLWQQANIGEYPEGSWLRSNRPHFTGIAPSEVAQLVAKYQTSPTTMSQADQAIALLATDHTFEVIQFWPVSASRNAAALADFMNLACRMTIEHGFWSFYFYEAHELGYDLDSDGLPYQDLGFPQWLGLEFQVETGSALAQIVYSGVPSITKVAQFPFTPTERSFPDVATAAFAFYMAIERKRAIESAILQGTFKQDWSTVARFDGLPDAPGQYFVSMRGTDNSLLPKDQSLHPRIGARLRIEVKARNFTEANQQAHVFVGFVSQDIFDSGCQVCAVVVGVDLSKCNFANFKNVVAGGSNVEFEVNIKLIDDATPSNRQHAAIRTIQSYVTAPDKHKRTHGVDIPHIVLRAPSTISNTGSLREEMGAEQDKIMKAIMKRAKLNHRQISSMFKSLHSKEGITLTNGPPGTGKTKTKAATAIAHAEVGHSLPKRRPVLVCAPTNLAVTSMMNHLKELNENHLTIVRFKGASLTKNGKVGHDRDGDIEMKERASAPKPAPKPDAAIDMECDIPSLQLSTHAPKNSTPANIVPTDPEKATEADLLEAEAAMWDMVIYQTSLHQTSSDGEDHDFHLVLSQKIKDWASWINYPGLEHPMSKQAAEHLAMSEKLNNKDIMLEKAERRRLTLSMRDLFETMSEHFIAKEIDIIAVTNSSSVHRILVDTYKPRVVLVDECPLTSIMDAAIPVAAYINTVEQLDLSGDPNQGKPYNPTSTLNEFSQILGLSLYTAITELTMYENLEVKLCEQYRMHPDLSKPVSDIWYKGALQDHESVKVLKPIWTTMESVLQGLGTAWGKHRRTVFDVSTPSGESEMWHQKDGTSLFNELEASAVIALIKKAIHADPPPGGEKIHARDFLIITPYVAQAQLIQQLCFKEGINQVRVEVQNVARVSTVKAVQGAEAPFVIHSLVRNDRDGIHRLNFVAERDNLNVSVSRAQQGLFMFGNYATLIDIAVNSKPGRAYGQGGVRLDKHSNKFKHFGELLRHVHQEQDLINTEDGMPWLLENKMPKFRVKPSPPNLSAAQADAAAEDKQFNASSHFKAFDQDERQRQKNLNKRSTPSSSGGGSGPPKKTQRGGQANKRRNAGAVAPPKPKPVRIASTYPFKNTLLIGTARWKTITEWIAGHSEQLNGNEIASTLWREIEKAEDWAAVEMNVGMIALRLRVPPPPAATTT